MLQFPAKQRGGGAVAGLIAKPIGDSSILPRHVKNATESYAPMTPDLCLSDEAGGVGAGWLPLASW